jgi:hypothetical protein
MLHIPTRSRRDWEGGRYISHMAQGGRGGALIQFGQQIQTFILIFLPLLGLLLLLENIYVLYLHFDSYLYMDSYFYLYLYSYSFVLVLHSNSMIPKIFC